MNDRDPYAERKSLLRLSVIVTVVSMLLTAILVSLTSVDLRSQMTASVEAIGWGAVISLPMIALFLALRQIPWRPIREVYEVVEVARSL